MANQKQTVWRIALKLAVSCVLLIWIFNAIFQIEARRIHEAQGLQWQSLSVQERIMASWTEGPEQLWLTLRQIKPGFFLASVLFMGSTLLIGIIRWRWLLRFQGVSLSFGRATEISMVAHFFNAFLLGNTGGDFLKAYYVARETHAKKVEAVATVFVDRLFGLFSMLLFGSLFLVVNLKLILAAPRLASVSMVLLMMLGACFISFMLAFWGGISRRWPKCRSWLRRLPKGDMIERSLDSCRRFGLSRPFIFKAILLSMVLTLACVLQIQSLVVGLDESIPFTMLLFVVPTIISISAMPVTPNGLGVRENLYVLILAAPGLDVPPAKALTISLLAYAGSLLWSLAGGVVYLTFRKRHHLTELELQ